MKNYQIVIYSKGKLLSSIIKAAGFCIIDSNLIFHDENFIWTATYAQGVWVTVSEVKTDVQ